MSKEVVPTSEHYVGLIVKEVEVNDMKLGLVAEPDRVTV
jgi:hypothetical protein